MSALDFAPVKFTPSTLNCVCADGRTIQCQKVQQDDTLSFQFIPPICSDELITCGDFNSSTCTAANWTTTGWVWSSGQVNHVVGSTSALSQSSVVQSGQWYKVTYTVKRVVNQLIEVEGSVQCKLGTATLGAKKSGTYTEYIFSNGTAINFVPTSDFDGAIDDVSVYQINTANFVFLIDANGNPVGSANPANFANGTGYYNELWSSFEAPDGCYNIVVSYTCDACVQFGNMIVNGSFAGNADGWTVGDGWAYGSNQVCSATVVSTLESLNQQIDCLKKSTKYILRFTVRGQTAGKLDVKLGETAIPTSIIADGNYEYTITTANSFPLTYGFVEFLRDNNFDGCVDNVQVYLHIDSYPQTLISGCYELKESHPCTSLLEWTNKDNAFGFDYTSFNIPLKHRLRCNLILHKPKYPNETEIFKNSEGGFEKTFATFVKQWEAIIVEQPEYIHDALACAMQHDYFYINNELYITQGNYDPNFQNGYNFADAIFTVGKNPDNKINLNCG